MNCRVIILRPQPGADTTAARAREMGFEPLILPLFTVEPLAWEPPDPTRFEALMLTSANAARHAGPELARYAHLPLYAVGEATARTVRQIGLEPVAVGEAGAAVLLDMLRAAGRRHVLHLCGADVTDADGVGLEITRIPVYRAVENSETQDLANQLNPGDIIFLHSPRAGSRLAALVAPKGRGGLSVIAISPAALAAAGNGWAGATSAPSPTDAAMLALALELCHKSTDDARDAARRE